MENINKQYSLSLQQMKLWQVWVDTQFIGTQYQITTGGNLLELNVDCPCNIMLYIKHGGVIPSVF